MSDTTNESAMADDPQIRVADLRNDISLMRFAGFWPDKVECGPIVFDFLIGWVLIANQMPVGEYWNEERRHAREERMRRELLAGLTDMTFEGMPVTLHDDVPDGRFWPPRDRGGFIVKPFTGTEAAYVSPI